ncbi:MAG: diacylglycerol kinase family lipid kinase [Armatimonadetes bacterium]|nr:diacylglycerol kinase family lipid kinase [Armatimonadota bacterium]MDI9585337.1 diacylglycerol kinase family lipid kinase [Acidobacteriota bacterium]
MTQRAIIIANPAARGIAHRPGAIGEVADRLRGDGIDTEVILTTGPGHATSAARQAAGQGLDLVVVAGGDGTINEAVQGLAGTDTALGIVPLGTGNVLAWYMGLEREDIPGACRVITQGARREIDLGRLNGRYFINMAGIGLDAQVAADVDPTMKRSMGRLGFMWQFIVTLVIRRPWPFDVRVDNQHVSGRLWSVIICNTPVYTWRVSMAKSAHPADGLLDIVLVHKCARGQLLEDLSAMFLHSSSAADSEHMQVIRGRHLEVRSLPDAPWQVEGEVGGKTPVVCDVAPLALKLAVPPDLWE